MAGLIIRMLLLAPLILIAGGLLWLRSSLPVSEGRLAVDGLDAEASIARDAHGIPTSGGERSTTRLSPWASFMPQDRLFQMDLMRRAGAGRLLRMVRRAQPRHRPLHAHHRPLPRRRAPMPLLSPRVHAALDAYAAGVNAVSPTPRRAAAGILSAQRRARAVAARRHAGLGQAHGAAARRQFPRRADACAACAALPPEDLQCSIRPIPRMRR